MAFEVPTGRVGSPRRWPVLVPLVVAAVVLVVGLAGAPARTPSPPLAHATPTAAPAANASRLPPSRVRPSPAAPLASLAPVAHLECGTMAADDCPRAVAAARVALFPGHAPLDRAVASRSLICGDSFDCPRWFLDQARFVGSLALTFADGRVAWVNVVETPPDARAGSRREFVGRVVRWFEAKG